MISLYANCTYLLSYTRLMLGWGGVALILMFTINATFIGSRLGLCWVILEERYEEFRKQIRDPYPSIGEKAFGRWGR
jgi:vesicular inhibitory amino acid transporter